MTYIPPVDAAPNADTTRSFGTVPLVVPAGVLLPFAGATVPEGYEFCYGQLVKRAIYKRLFAAIGTTWNTGGEAADEFRFPDFRGRVPVGLDNMGGTDAARLSVANTLGGVGGVESVTLTSAQSGMPSHTHEVAYQNHSYTQSGGATIRNVQDYPPGDASSTTSATSANASSSHDNMPPYGLVNYIIKL